MKKLFIPITHIGPMEIKQFAIHHKLLWILIQFVYMVLAQLLVLVVMVDGLYLIGLIRELLTNLF